MGNKGYRTIAGPVTLGAIATQFLIGQGLPYNRTLVDWLARPMPMDELKALIAGLGPAPALTKHTGTNRFQNLGEEELLVVLEKFQAGIEYDEDMPQHKFWREFGPKIQQLGQRARDHEVTLLTERLLANPICYDGKALFADDHPVKDGVNDNLLSGSGTSQTNFETDLWLAIAALRRMKDIKGQYLNRPLTKIGVHIPPELEQVAEKQRQSIVIGTDTNIIRNRYELHVDVLLSDANDWYVYDLDGPEKLTAHGEYLPPMVKQYKNDDNDLVKISAKRIHNFFPADYTKGAKIVNA